VGELDEAKRVDAEVSCVESEERCDGPEKVEYCDRGCVWVCVFEELVEVGSREWVG